MLNNFKLAFDSWLIGFISFPILYYIFIKVLGPKLWQDLKSLGYRVWDAIKGVKNKV